MKFCQKCNGRVDTTTEIDDVCPNCINSILLKTPEPAQGWECPKCGAVLAPIQPYCTFCAPQHPLWTWDVTK